MSEQRYPGLTTLEEDFRALGLMESAPAAGVVTERMKTIHVTSKGPGGKVMNKAKRRRVNVLQGADLAKRRREMRTAGAKRSAAKSARKRRTGKGKARAARQARALGQSMSFVVQNGLLGLARAASSSILHRAAGFLTAEAPAMEAKQFVRALESRRVEDEVLSLLEETSKLVQGVLSASNDDVVKSFAGLALSADDLSGFFAENVETVEPYGLAEEFELLGKVLSQVANDAGSIAKGLQDNVKESFDLAALSTVFHNQLDLTLKATGLVGFFEGSVSAEELAKLTECEMSDEEEDDEEEEPGEGE